MAVLRLQKILNLNNEFIRLIFKFFRHLFAFSLCQGGRPALVFGSKSKNLLGKSLNLLPNKLIIQVFSLLLFCFAHLLHAVNVTNNADSGAGSLRNAILTLNPAGDTIDFTGSFAITLTSGSLPPINMNTSGTALSINGMGNSVIIDGSSLYQAFFLQQGTITFQNFNSLTIQNAAAIGSIGGDGGVRVTASNNKFASGGGGGLGAGGAVFVNQFANVVFDGSVNTLVLNGNKAIGGSGGAGGGFPGSSTPIYEYAVCPGGGGGGGMIAPGGKGGNPSGSDFGGPGGSGGGGGGGGNSIGFDGGNGTGGATNIGGAGGNGGGGSGGMGGASPSCSGSGCLVSGLSGMSAPASPSAFSGGGGGSGMAGYSNADSPNIGGGAGGNGNDFAGGGGAGGSGVVNAPASGGGGGFGGGGGGCGTESAPNSSAPPGGTGGFGGGGGGSQKRNGSASTFGGGIGQSSNGSGGGGGAGLGGAIFVREGGTISFSDGLSLNSNITAGGSGGTGMGGSSSAGSPGIGAGNDFFLSSGGTLTFNNIAPLTVSSTISSNNKTGGAGSQDGGGITKTNSGILTLSGINNLAVASTGTPIGYTGTTVINGGILAISNDNNLGIISGSGPTASGNVSIGNGTWQFLNSMTSLRLVDLTGAGAIDTIGNAVVLQGVISGVGSFTKASVGSLELRAVNTYQGGATILNGTLIASADNNLGAATAPLTIGGGSTTGATFQAKASFTLNASRVVTLGVNGAGILNTIDTNGQQLDVDSMVTGTGSLTVIDSTATTGTLVLSNSANNFTTSMTINGATVRMGASPALAMTLDVAVLSGTFDLAGFGQSIGNFSGNAGTSTMIGGATLAVNQTMTETYSGIISGASGAFVKNGAGTLILAGANTYSGGTTINGGILQMGAFPALPNNGAVVLNGGTLDLNDFSQSIGNFSGNMGTFVTLGSISSTQLSVNQTSPGTYGGIISGNGSVAMKGTSVLTFTGMNAYTGGTIINSGTVALSGAGTLDMIGSLTVNGTFDITQSTASPITVGTLNGSGTIALGMNELIVDATGSSLFSGVIQDSGIGPGVGGAFTLGTGTLTLTGMNTYTGSTNISMGTTLALSGNGSLPNSTSLNVDGTFDISQSTVSSTAVGTINGSGTIALGSHQLVSNSSGMNTFSGVIQDPGIGPGVGGSFVLQGTGVLTFTGMNTYTGGTTIGVGTTLALSMGGSLASTGNVIVNGTFDITQSTASSITVGALSGSGIVALGMHELISNFSGSSTFSGVIQDLGIGPGVGGAFTKAGSGTLILSGLNTYTGGTTINGGTLQMGIMQALPLGGVVTLNNGILNLAGFSQSIGNFSGNAGTSTMIGGATLTINQTMTGTYGGVISGTGGALIKNGMATLILTNANTYTGGTTINDGTLSLQGNGSLYSLGTVDVASIVPGATFDISMGNSVQIIGDLAGLATTGFVNLGANQLRFGTSNGPVDFQGVIFGSGGIVKKGTGTAVLSNTNMYTGDTTVFAGTLSLEGVSAISTSSLVFVNQNATLDITNSTAPSQTITNLVGPPGSFITLGNKNLTFGTNVPETVFAGIISDMGTGSITKQGSGNVILTGPSTYQGGTTLADGTLTIFRNTSIGASGTNLFVTNNATLALGNFQTFNHPTIITAGNTLNIFTAFHPTISSVISDTGGASVNKTGPGRLTLSNTNTYTGLTTVSNGTLALNGGSIVGAVDVLNSTTLEGIGSIGGDVHVLMGGTIRPGSASLGIGTLLVGGMLTLDGGSNTYIEINGTSSSLIAVAGMATLSGSLTINADPDTYIAGASYTLLTGNPVMGMFTPPVNFTGQPLGTTTIIYHPTFVELLLVVPPSPPPPPSPVCQVNLAFLKGNPNGENLANYLNLLAADPSIESILCVLASLPQEELNAAINSISPARNAIASYVGEVTMFLIANTVSCRMAEQRIHLRYLQKYPKEEPVYPAAFLPRLSTTYLASMAKEDASPSFHDLRSFETDLRKKTAPPAAPIASYDNPYGSSQTLLKKTDRYAVWIEGLGELINQAEADENPSYISRTAGGLLGMEYYGQENGLLGAAICYAQSHIHQGWNAGKDKIDFYAGTIYGTGTIGQGYVEVGLAGAFNRFFNTRNIHFPNFNAKAKSAHRGGQIVPHLSVGYDFNFSWAILEPFMALDFDALFQTSFSETGAGVLNMHSQAAWSAILRTEIGLNAYELWHTSIGDFVLRETLSYVNKEPMHVGDITANLAGFPASFGVNSFRENKSFLSPGFQFFYRSPKGGFISLYYMGEFQGGKGRFISNNVLAKLGVFF